MLVQSFCDNRNDLFADEFFDCLPTVCPECGMPMEMSEALTGLHCSNPKCPDKVAQRLVAIANKLGVKDLGDARAIDFIRKFQIDNPLLIFSYEPDEDGTMTDRTNIEISKRIADAFKARNKFTLAEYIKIANLPYIQESATSVFEGYDDLAEAYEVIERGGVEYIRDKLNIKEKGTEEVSIRALKVYDSLMTYKSDLFDALDGVEIIKIYSNKEMTSINAVCSTAVGQGFKTKADFYATCNNLYGNMHINFGNSVTKKTEYLVWAGADGSPSEVTNKVKKARAYQEQGVDIEIVTALQFLDILEKLSKG
jgi:NAD-dependent DNA ligase